MGVTCVWHSFAEIEINENFLSLSLSLRIVGSPTKIQTGCLNTDLVC